MTHEELLAHVRSSGLHFPDREDKIEAALIATIKLHQPVEFLSEKFTPYCKLDEEVYPCRTIQKIEKVIASVEEDKK
mgnify:FL=1